VKIRLALLVVAAQFAVVAFMAAQREWIARTGTTLTLRTAPMDPHDPMRGEFVRFRYEINVVPAHYFRGGLEAWKTERDHRASRRLKDHVVYAALENDAHGFAQLVALSDSPPARGAFLRGRVAFATVGTGGIESVQVRYGVEALFMQQGAAKKIETLALGERRGVPIDCTVAVGGAGIGVLRSFAWEPLGITVTPDPPPARPPAQARDQRPLPQLAGIAGVTVELKNFSDRDVAIVDLPDGKSFRLRADASAEAGGYRWVGENLPPTTSPDRVRIVVLRPGETHRVHLALTEPAWWVEGGPTNQPATPLVDVRERWHARFRIEYAPPPPDQLRGLPNAHLVRHVPLVSRVFTGGVD
jgi:uncharacterized membrane-anchored protein